MSGASFSLIVNQPWEAAINQVGQRLSDAGLRAVRTFDLQVARHAHVDCTCPHHGTAQCDCQMVVLLVYSLGFQPVSLMAHGHDGKTWLSLVDTAQQPADTAIETAIRQALSSLDITAIS